METMTLALCNSLRAAISVKGLCGPSLSTIVTETNYCYSLQKDLLLQSFDAYDLAQSNCSSCDYVSNFLSTWLQSSQILAPTPFRLRAQ